MPDMYNYKVILVGYTTEDHSKDGNMLYDIELNVNKLKENKQ